MTALRMEQVLLVTRVKCVQQGEVLHYELGERDMELEGWGNGFGRSYGEKSGVNMMKIH